MMKNLVSSLLLAAAAAGLSVPASADGRLYTIQKGDTLYGIYRKTGVHPNKLKRWNGISNANVIRPGMQLRLTDPRSASSAPPAGASTTAPSTTSVEPPAAPRQPIAAPKPPEKPAKIIDYQTEDDLPLGQTAGGVKYSDVAYIESDTALELDNELNKAKPGTTPTTTTPPASSNGAKWQWPVPGRAIEARGDGVILYANYGDPIQVVADGKVVYTGNGQGLIGQTIVVQHDNGYMSIYGYCKKFLAKDGDNVVRGQAIAEVGSYKAQTAGVYVEMRKHGKSIGPNTLLPTR